MKGIGGFNNQSAGCHQGRILAPVATWLRIPGSGGFWQLDYLDLAANRRRPRGRCRDETMHGLASGVRAIITANSALTTAFTAPPGSRPVMSVTSRITASTVVTARHGSDGPGSKSI